MPKENRYPIDKEKFRKEITRRGLSLTEASLEIGRASSYLSNIICEGNINKATITVLEKLYNLHYEAYKQTESVPESAQTETSEEPPKGQMTFQLPSMTKDEFWKVIYTAVYEAVKKAWSE